MALQKVFTILCGIALATTALPAEENRSGQSRNVVSPESDLMDSIYSDCLRKDSVSCVKYKLFSFVDKMLDQKDTFALTEGVTVIKTDKPIADAEGDAPRTLLTGNESIESMIINRVQNFLQTHTIKVDLKGSEVINAVTSTGRAFEDVSDNLFGGNIEANATGKANEARGKKKKVGKLLGPLFLVFGFIFAALLPLKLGAIALIAGHAFLAGKLALVMSVVMGLRKLMSQEKHVTYEVVAHPHHSTSHSSSHGEAYSVGGAGLDVGGAGGGGSYGGSGHGGWGRSVDIQDLAYRGQKAE